jgi:hypothetical protein
MAGAATPTVRRVIKSNPRKRGLKERPVSPSLEIAVRVGGAALVFGTTGSQQGPAEPLTRCNKATGTPAAGRGFSF